jgi:hypothetical protein
MSYQQACSAAIIYTTHFGVSVLPIGNDKRPLIKWKEYQDRKPTFEEILSWPKEGFNLAVITGRISGGLVIVDCESREDAAWFWQEKGRSPSIVKTRRGFHLYFQSSCEVRNAQKCFGRYDVRGEGGYALAPPSAHAEGNYSWSKRLVPIDELPPFQPTWREESPSRTLDERRITDGGRYIDKIEAVEGDGGDANTFRAALALRDSGLSEGEALYVLLGWNRTNAKPPWSAKELLHKICCAYGEPI